MSQPTPSEQWSDEQLMDRLRNGDTDSFETLLRRYENELFGYLRRYLGNATLADDVFQNTFVQIFRKVDQYEKGRRFRPWLYTIATNQAIDAMRRAGRQQVLSLDNERETDVNGQMRPTIDLIEGREENPLDSLEGEELRVSVREGVNRLPDHLRLPLILAYYQGLKYKDIGETLGIPVGTVKSRLHTALQRLHEIWAESPLMEAQV